MPKFETSAKKRGSTDRKAGQFKKGMTETASGQEVRDWTIPVLYGALPLPTPRSSLSSQRFEALYRNAQTTVEKKKRQVDRNYANPEGCTFEPKFEAKTKGKAGPPTKGGGPRLKR